MNQAASSVRFIREQSLSPNACRVFARLEFVLEFLNSRRCDRPPNDNAKNNPSWPYRRFRRSDGVGVSSVWARSEAPSPHRYLAAWFTY
jgi:hypothetical protein